MHSSTFGAALVESPSLWFADERFLRCEWRRAHTLWGGLAMRAHCGTASER